MEDFKTREIANTIKDYVDTCEKGEVDVEQIIFLIDQGYEYFEMPGNED